MEMPVGILLVNVKGVIEFANNRTMRIFKCTMEDLLGKPWSDLMVSSDSALGGQNARDPRRNLTILQESDGRRLSGEIFPIKMSIRPFDPTCTKMIVTIEDLTKEREAERLKQEFIAMISHDLRSPLTAVHGKLNLLADQSSVQCHQMQSNRRRLQWMFWIAWCA